MNGDEVVETTCAEAAATETEWVQPPPRDPWLMRLPEPETRWSMTRGFGTY